MISTAYAQTAAPAGAESQLLGFLPIILMFVAMYFLMIRPQMKRAKEHRNMLAALHKGDEVVTAGGSPRSATPMLPSKFLLLATSPSK